MDLRDGITDLEVGSVNTIRSCVMSHQIFIAMFILYHAMTSGSDNSYKDTDSGNIDYQFNTAKIIKDLILHLIIQISCWFQFKSWSSTLMGLQHSLSI